MLADARADELCASGELCRAAAQYTIHVMGIHEPSDGIPLSFRRIIQSRTDANRGWRENK
jgi:hypothetical protein